jgi:hypothetical protein
MKVHKQKVIVLSKNEADSDFFICPCQVCTDKLIEKAALSENLTEVRSIIEDILETTVLSAKDYQVQISFSGDRAVESTFKKIILSNNISEFAEEVRPAIAVLKKLHLFVDQFNKKYRHVLICELNQLKEDLITYLNLYKEKNEREELPESQLWTLQNIMLSVMAIAETLEDINGEQLIQSGEDTKLIALCTVSKSKIAYHLKSKFNKALALPEFQPQCTPDDLPSQLSSW